MKLKLVGIEFAASGLRVERDIRQDLSCHITIYLNNENSLLDCSTCVVCKMHIYTRVLLHRAQILNRRINEKRSKRKISCRFFYQCTN